MIFRIILFFTLLSIPGILTAQTSAFADSIRIAYAIPELGYAVVSSTEILEVHTLGVKQIGTDRAAEPDDRFRIGSNTKAITGFIAALLVKEGKISWDTPFFDLYPELKAKSDPAYHDLTLLNLLSFRTRLYAWTYTNAKPKKRQFKGDEAQQRYEFTRWFFRQPPVADTLREMHFSNLGYVAAGLMLEQVTGKSYKQLVEELGTRVGIHFYFGNPNTTDPSQPWGHDKDLNPEPPGDSYKLNWLLPAGNITLSLPDYAKFIQLQLQGLAGQSTLLPQEAFEFLFSGLPGWSVGWNTLAYPDGRTYSFNAGNPGTFLSKVFVFPQIDRAFIVLTNAQTDAAEYGIDVLLEELYEPYILK